MAGTGGSSLLGSGVSTASGSDINTGFFFLPFLGTSFSHIYNLYPLVHSCGTLVSHRPHLNTILPSIIFQLLLSHNVLTSVLHLRRIYGVNSHVVNNIAWSDESTMVYVACHSIVLYDRKSKKQKFLSFNSDDISDAVTSFTVGVSRKLAAVAEKGNDVMPKVHIFDFKKHRRVKTLHLYYSIYSHSTSFYKQYTISAFTYARF